jgi:glycosyltransferase involved in cell wall biosynthesis
MPEISVIMGVHNGGAFLAETVASVQRQTFRDWELVIVDNGSTDGAVPALAAAMPDDRVRVITRAEALGPSGALQVACEAAKGRYLAVLDQDDIALPRRLEMQRAYLDLQPEVVLLGTAVADIDGKGNILGREPFVGLHEDIHALTAHVHVLRHSSVMFRRSLLDRVSYRALLGGGEDFDFFARAAEVGRLACLPEVLCHYRIHAGNITITAAARMAVNGALVRMLTRRRRTGLPEDFAPWHRRFSACQAEGHRAEARTQIACARLLRSEKHHDLAAVHAWLAWRTGGGWRAGWEYAAAIGGGLIRGRVARVALVKAWLKEPAHQLLRDSGAPDRIQF